MTEIREEIEHYVFTARKEIEQHIRAFEMESIFILQSTHRQPMAKVMQDDAKNGKAFEQGRIVQCQGGFLHDVGEGWECWNCARNESRACPALIRSR